LTLVDAYGLVALLADEPAAAEVESVIREGACGVVAINLAEALDVCHRLHGIPFPDLRSALEPLTLSASVTVVESDEPSAWLAGELRGRYYERKTCALSIADCFLIAHAARRGEALATSDPALAHVARAEALTVIALPDRAGARP
jgi:predicted nucleic acid-binding protein